MKTKSSFKNPVAVPKQKQAAPVTAMQADTCAQSALEGRVKKAAVTRVTAIESIVEGFGVVTRQLNSELYRSYTFRNSSMGVRSI